MLLVPEEVMKRLTSPAPNPVVESVGRADENLQTIMDSKLKDDTKWKLYQQSMHRYIDQFNSSINPDAATVTSKSHDMLSTETIVSCIPDKYKSKARQLVELLRSSEKLLWDQNGQVNLNGRQLIGSNITDLVVDVLRASKQTPIGSDQFIELLAELNIPESLITNPERRNKLRAVKHAMSDTEEDRATSSKIPRLVTREALKRKVKEKSAKQTGKGKRCSWKCYC